MFYSHEVLTSHRYGVATVWLVATLGPKSGLKRVNRKRIQSVNVPKACEIFMTPETPMALRLTSNLLYGVSRVYQHQCGYVLTDAQGLQNNMLALLKAARTTDLDMDGTRARPETLLLGDDPTFLPELNLSNLNLLPDLLSLDLFAAGDSQSTMLSPHTSQGSLLSSHRLMGADHLVIPSSDTVEAGDIGGFQVASDRASLQGPTEVLGADNDGFLPDADFTFDADGNMISLQDNPMLGAPVQPPDQSHASGEHRISTVPAIDELPDLILDDDHLELGGLPVDEAEPASPGHAVHQRTSSESVVAPVARKKTTKKLPMDHSTELPGQMVRDWGKQYLQNMAAASSNRKQHQAPSLGRLNARFLILDAGLGGIGWGLGRGNMASPLSQFCGEQLYHALIEERTGQKRSYDDMTGESPTPSRRVRARSEEMARGDGLPFDGDGGSSDMDGMQIETAREEAAPLDDFSSMPWNVRPSARGSSIGTGHAGSVFGSTGRPSSLAGPMAPLGVLPLSRPGSRMTSPLIDRAAHSRAISEGLADARSGSGFVDGGFEVAADLDEDDTFQMYGLAAGLTTQDAEDSQTQRALLDTESNNFLGFIHNAILVGEENSVSSPSIKFEELLDPNTHSRIVAAQGLLHALSLGTRNLLRAEQDTAYGAIVLIPLQLVAAL